MPSTWSRPSGTLPDVSSALAFRAAGPADAAAIARVHQESWRTTYSGILPTAVIAELAGRKTEERWHSRLDTPSTSQATFVAHDGAEPIGFAWCGEARHKLEGLEAEVYALYVLQPYQRRGGGSGLLAQCAHHFLRQGLFGFYLWALKANRARLFYEALGGAGIAEKSERLGQHSYLEVAYAWHDLAPIAARGAAPPP